MDASRVRDADGELVEIRTGMEARRASVAESGLELRRASGPERRDVVEPVRPDRRQVHARGEGEECLVGADI